MHIFMTVVALIIVLGVVVFVHELGHFLAARWAGVRVDKFSIGFGPAVLKWHDKYGTQWQLACLPLGGYVSIYGQEDMFDRKKYEELDNEPESQLPAVNKDGKEQQLPVLRKNKKTKQGHYLSAPAWKQFIIISAGVFMNFMLAWAIYSAAFIFHPREVQLPVVGQVIQQSVAFNAGVKPGDVIVKIDGKKISNWGEIILAKELAAKHSADVQLLRGQKIVDVALLPAERWGLVADGSKTELRKKGFIDGLYWGARETYNQSKTLLVVLKQIITGERSSKQLGSFITIAQVSGHALEIGFWAFLSIIALLSVNLGVVNLLPLPVLDGGFLLILIIEFIIRKKLSGKAMEIVFAIGWILIIGLMLLTMWNDLARVFGLN